MSSGQITGENVDFLGGKRQAKEGKQEGEGNLVMYGRRNRNMGSVRGRIRKEKEGGGGGFKEVIG